MAATGAMEASKKRLQEVIPTGKPIPDDGTRDRAEVYGDVPLMEQRFLKLDGHEIDVETIAFPFLFKDEQAVQVIFRDISEKKQAEARIRKNETLFTQLFNSVPMAVVMLDDTGKVEQINPGFEEMFGYELAELKGKNLAQRAKALIDVAHPSVREELERVAFERYGPSYVSFNNLVMAESI